MVETFLPRLQYVFPYSTNEPWLWVCGYVAVIVVLVVRECPIYVHVCPFVVLEWYVCILLSEPHTWGWGGGCLVPNQPLVQLKLTVAESTACSHRAFCITDSCHVSPTCLSLLTLCFPPPLQGYVFVHSSREYTSPFVRVCNMHTTHTYMPTHRHIYILI